MKIHFTNKEYGTLLEMIHIASWVIHSHDIHPPSDQDPHHVLEQKILSLAKEFGCGEQVDYDEKLRAHFTTRAFDDSVMPLIDKYDEDCFWMELADRLIERDMVRALGEKRYRTLEIEERIAKEMPYEQKYENEFAEHGVERLEVIAGPLTTGHN
jgi:hypothetical protein